MDLLSLYNIRPWSLNPVLIGSAVILKTVVLFLFVESSWYRRITGTLAINIFGAATEFFLPVWVLIGAVSFKVGIVPWCGFVPALSAVIAAVLDIVILRYGVRVGSATTLPVTGPFLVANLLSVVLGHWATFTVLGAQTYA